MADVEIYDSSDSQLSSDEYSHDEDDDALMDAAVSKQPTDAKAGFDSPAKSGSTAAVGNQVLTGNLMQQKPPANRDQTDKEIKYLQQKRKFHLHYKRRSIMWLNRHLKRKVNYLELLKKAVPRERARNFDYQQTIEKKQQVRREERCQHSPELICLDDTENEESPEKLAEAAKTQNSTSRNPTPAREMPKQPNEEVAYNENGTVLEEFLTLKTAIVETDIEPLSATAVAYAALNINSKPSEQMELANSVSAIISYNNVLDEPKLPTTAVAAPVRVVSPKADHAKKLDYALLEQLDTLKRRRSIPSPDITTNKQPVKKKLNMPMLDDEFFESIPHEISTEQQYVQETQQSVVQLTTPNISQTPALQITARDNAEQSNAQAFKLGSPFSLAPTPNEFYTHPQQQMQELASSISFSLDTPSPAVEPMEIVYPNEKAAATNVQAQNSCFIDPNNIKRPMQATPAVTSTLNSSNAAPCAAASAVQPELQTATRPKPQPEPLSSHPQIANSTKARVAPNSDAEFHQRISSKFSEYNDIMTDKLNSVNPHLKLYAEEKQRIKTDIKTLDKLISDKEDEYNRLLHMRCVKEELHARIERRERVLIINENLTPILQRSCSISELYDLHGMLTKEQDDPLPSRSGRSAIVQFINALESTQADIKTLRSAMGLLDSSLAAQRFEDDRSRRHHFQETRTTPPSPPPVIDRSSYGRQGAVRDVRSLVEDFRREHPEELPLVGKRAKMQPPQSRYANSTPNLAADASTYSNQQVPLRNRVSLDNLNSESTPTPLYNSSPLHSTYHRNRSQAHNDSHSIDRNNANLDASRQPLEAPDYRAAQNNRYSNRNHSSTKPHHGVATTNGPKELKRCQFCKRHDAIYMCAGCQNQWYCCRECQLLDWDKTHWAACPN